MLLAQILWGDGRGTLMNVVRNHAWARKYNIEAWTWCVGTCDIKNLQQTVKVVTNISLQHKWFEKHYVHNSINPRVYERNCFTRFFVLEQMMLMSNATRIVFIDSDIVLLPQARMVLQTMYDMKKHIALTSTKSTFLSAWSLNDLQKYTRF